MDLPAETAPVDKNSANPAADRSIRRRRGGVHPAFLPLAFLIGLGVGYLIWNRPAQPAAAVQPTAPAQAAEMPQQVKRYEIPIDDDPILGAADAPVTLIMYSDYECPYCRKWYDEVFKQLVRDYPGQVRFVYKDFPLFGLHENAAPAAEAADCAGEQGKYWEYQDKLFGMKAGLGADAFTQYASDLSLDSAQFADCVSTRRYKDEVESDYQFAANLGISSTPTFFVNGLAVVGAQPLEVFKNVIDQELAGKNP